MNILSVVATNTYDGKGAQTYMKPVYLHHFHIRIYKRNSTESLLLQYILFILIYHGLCPALFTQP